MMHWFSDHDRKARKSHRCTLCGLAIDPGTRYRECRGSDSGDMVVVKVHWPCDALYCDYARNLGLLDDDPADWNELLLWTIEEGKSVPGYIDDQRRERLPDAHARWIDGQRKVQSS